VATVRVWNAYVFPHPVTHLHLLIYILQAAASYVIRESESRPGSDLFLQGRAFAWQEMHLVSPVEVRGALMTEADDRPAGSGQHHPEV
jgi:hypothetical protein